MTASLTVTRSSLRWRSYSGSCSICFDGRGIGTPIEQVAMLLFIKESSELFKKVFKKNNFSVFGKKPTSLSFSFSLSNTSLFFVVFCDVRVVVVVFFFCDVDLFFDPLLPSVFFFSFSPIWRRSVSTGEPTVDEEDAVNIGFPSESIVMLMVSDILGSGIFRS